MQWSPRTGLTVRRRWEPVTPGTSGVVLAGRAIRVP
jgi:hypothetical protein